MSDVGKNKEPLLLVLVGKKTLERYPEKFAFSFTLAEIGTNTTSSSYTALAIDEPSVFEWLEETLPKAIAQVKIKSAQLSIRNGYWLNLKLQQEKCESVPSEIMKLLLERLEVLYSRA